MHAYEGKLLDGITLKLEQVAGNGQKRTLFIKKIELTENESLWIIQPSQSL